MGVRIVLADIEPIGLALRRFKRLWERHGVPQELRRRGCFIKPTQTRRAKRFKKRFKARMATLLAKQGGEQLVSSLAETRQTFWKRTGKPSLR
jgi:ribosomal protein S21